jgi:hypothetical protein
MDSKCCLINAANGSVQGSEDGLRPACGRQGLKPAFFLGFDVAAEAATP